MKYSFFRGVSRRSFAQRGNALRPEKDYNL
jgi:hypothetical protein